MILYLLQKDPWFVSVAWFAGSWTLFVDFYHSVLSLFSVVSGDGVDLAGHNETGGSMDLSSLSKTNLSPGLVKIILSRHWADNCGNIQNFALRYACILR